MYEWMVVTSRAAHLGSVRYSAAPARGTRGEFVAESVQEASAFDYPDNIEIKVRFVRNEVEANQLAEWLVGKHAGLEVAVCRATLVLQSKPGPVLRSKFTPEGLMPV